MKPLKTQKRVYTRIQKFGCTMDFGRLYQGQGNVELKGLIIENPSELPFRFRRDVEDLPNRNNVLFLIGIPAEPLRDEDNNPIDSQGNPIVIPEPELTRVEYIRQTLRRGRKFTANNFTYQVMREVPLAVGDVNLYLSFICDTA